MSIHLTRIIITVFLVSIFFTTQVEPLTTDQKAGITNGLRSGNALAEVLKNGEFSESMTQLGTKLVPYLKVLGPLASLALGFIRTSDSREMRYMKEQFNRVNDKLDRISAEFRKVKNAIDWSSVQISFGTYERKIRAAEANLKRIYRVEGTAREQDRTYFVTKYENNFDDSVQNLYDGAMNNDRIFSKNILEAAVHQTEKHRRKFQQFSLGLVQLLIRGIQVKLSYFGMKNWSTDNLVKEWDQNMEKLRARILRISNEVRDAYKDQLKIDVQDIIKTSGSSSNKNVMTVIYKFVADKYDWRYWFVAVYDDMHGFDRHANAFCGGHVFLHQKGKNIIVSSQDKKYSSRFKKEKADAILQSVENDVKNCASGLRNPGARAKALNGHIVRKSGPGCVPYALQMTVASGNGLWFVSWGVHRSYRKIGLPKTQYQWYIGAWHDTINTCRIQTDWYYNMIIFG